MMVTGKVEKSKMIMLICHYLPFCLTPEKLYDCVLGLPTDQYLHMINQ